jgi:tetratricopeptide (TPR) repeat protein
LSNLRILRKRDDEALQCMDRIYEFTLSCSINKEDKVDNLNTHLNNLSEEQLPNHDLLLNLSKNYAEIGNYVKAIKILDILVKMNDEDLESWYLLSFNHYTIKNYKHSMKCLKNFKLAYDKISHKPDEISDIEEAAKELYETLLAVKKECGGELINHSDNTEQSADEEESSEAMTLDT